MFRNGIKTTTVLRIRRCSSFLFVVSNHRVEIFKHFDSLVIMFIQPVVFIGIQTCDTNTPTYSTVSQFLGTSINSEVAHYSHIKVISRHCLCPSGQFYTLIFGFFIKPFGVHFTIFNVYHWLTLYVISV